MGFGYKKLLAFCSFLILIAAVTAISLNDDARPNSSFSLTSNSLFGGEELSSPSDWVSQDQIKVYDNRIILELEKASWATFTDTNSMDPFLDETSNAIEIMPTSPEDIGVGDIISYESDYGIIIHRVVEIGEDDEGIYYIVKGDNNTFNDPEKVRFGDVVGVLVAIIY